MVTMDKKMRKLEGQMEEFSLKGKSHGKNEKEKLADIEDRGKGLGETLNSLE